LDSFKSGSLKVMVATDVAGRGIHVDGISHVINYTLPEEPEDYVHRIGRTGRAGKTGTSISFACEDDAFLLEPIEKLLGMKLACTMPEESLVQALPSRQKLASKKPVTKAAQVQPAIVEKQVNEQAKPDGETAKAD
jgi:ATP-dependent RNA helicase RhlB